MSRQDNKLEEATLGAGCFWCVEALFLQVKGITKVISGYAGGHVKNPSYEQVYLGTTGHIEVIQVTYDTKVLMYEDILKIFWSTHDPTTVNRQGADKGSQYRSAIFYRNEEEKLLATKYLTQLEQNHMFSSPIVTEILPLTLFYKAAFFYQNYYTNHSEQPYCQMVIRPKIDALKKQFSNNIIS